MAYVNKKNKSLCKISCRPHKWLCHTNGFATQMALLTSEIKPLCMISLKHNDKHMIKWLYLLCVSP